MLRLIWVILLCGIAQVVASAEIPLPTSGRVVLDQNWALLRDPGNTLAVEQLSQPEVSSRFQLQHDQPALGYVNGAVWLRITVMRPARSAPQWLLELRSPLLDDVALFLPRPGGGYEQRVAGDRQPVTGRDVAYRDPIFHLDLPPDRPVTFYVRVRSTSTMSFSLVMWSPDAFISFVNAESLLFGLFYAAHLVLLITCVWFYWVTSDLSFALFCLTVLVNLLTALGAEGHLYQYLLPRSPRLSEAVYTVSWLLGTPVGTLFAAHYLGLFGSQWRRWVWGACWLTAGVALAAAFCMLVTNVWWVRPLYQVWQLMVILVTLAIAACLARRGQKAARVIVVVLVLLLGGTMLRVARNVGGVDPGWLADNANYLGMLAFLLIMNSAISWRYSDLLAQKDAAQAEALRVARQAERELEAKVAQRTRALREAMAQVEASLLTERRAQEEQRQFLATVSHELRTPLAVIDATAQNLDLDDAHNDPLTSARYQKILRATQRLTTMLNDSLHEDGFELLRHGAQPAPTELGGLLEDAAAAARLLSEGHQLEVHAQDLPDTFLCDPSLLRLVLRTLADNAVKYTPAGSRVILRGKGNAEGVVLTVEDNGPGIAQADLPHVFERYYRGQNAGRMPGSGLGLPLARRMVEMQGGTLMLDSAPGHGCRATMFLPAAPAGAQASNSGSVKV